MEKKQNKKPKAKVVDLFCGIGGLTHGFLKEGFDVVAGIDIDESCKYGYENSNGAKFISKDISKVSAQDIAKLYGKDKGLKILVGCAPCQPFSKLNLNDVTEKEFGPILSFLKLIKEVRPDIVSMENVKELGKYPIFKTFTDRLSTYGYQHDYKVVDTSDYGVPQKRMRLVLLASKLGEIKLIEKTHEHNKVTVRDVIEGLEPIEDGQASARDPLHRARKLSDKNKKRIKATPLGGNSRSWGRSLQLACHLKKSGKTYRGSVYGRMRWDDPAPTMTTQCIGLGNGRFGHPEQNRAISLREAALFQTFPKSYQFYNPAEPMVVSDVARFIGNAVPVRLGQVIARSIKKHIAQVQK